MITNYGQLKKNIINTYIKNYTSKEKSKQKMIINQISRRKNKNFFHLKHFQLIIFY